MGLVDEFYPDEDQDPGKRREGDQFRERSCEDDDRSDDGARDEVCRPGLRPRGDVERRRGEGAGRRCALEEACEDVRRPLPEEVPVHVGDGAVGLRGRLRDPDGHHEPDDGERERRDEEGGCKGEVGNDGRREAGGDRGDAPHDCNLRERDPGEEGRDDDGEEEGDGAEALQLPEGEDKGDGEEADDEGPGLELVRVEEKIGYGKDLDRFPREPVAGEVPELAEDDEERCSRDEAGENGVRYEPGQAAGPDEPEPELENANEEGEDEEGGGDVGLGDRGEDGVDRDGEDV